MKKNVASQTIGAQMVSASDGSAFTGTVACAVTGDGGTQGAGGGSVTHEGNGYHSYAPTQAETNFDHVAFTFTGTGAIPATVQVYTSFPQTGDNFARLGAPAGGSVSADIAAVKAETATILGDTNDIQTRLPAALVSGRIDASVGAVAANAITAAAIADGAIDAATFAAGAITAAAIATGAVDADALAADAVAEIADGVWDEAIAGHLTAGSTGAALNAAGGSGDPWATGVPGAYGAGTAGFILGTNLDATVSSRASVAAVAAVQADTDDIQTRLPAALVSGRMDSHVGSIADALLTAAKFAAGAFDAVWTVAVRTLTAFGFSVTVGTNTDKTGYALTAADHVVGADTLLDRNMATGTDSGSTTVRTPRQAFRALRNRWETPAGVYTVYKEDDAAVSWTAAVTTDPLAEPVVSADPAGP